jgi:tRNA pseudouridine38-40 synthase
MRRRYFLEIAYHGKDYSGWQSQDNGVGVQEVVESALLRILGQNIEIVGSGRTDAGVHALQQIAHFDIDKDLPQNFLYSTNSVLPPALVIKDCFEVLPSTHARYSAISRSYLYRISRKKDPFDWETSWLFTGRLNIDSMIQAAHLLTQIQDFTAVSKYKADQLNHDCQVKQALWYEQGDKLCFEITANRFLWRMVRLLVGAMVDIGRDRLKISDFEELLLKKERGRINSAAPAKGLFLCRIDYESNVKIKKNL